MCGIAGIINFTRQIGDSEAVAVDRMTAAQYHRGPDDCGSFRDANAVFGHRRLSIIDTSVAGHQPMTGETAQVWVTYNGEIYNHRELREELLAAGHAFRSNSDTEVLVHGYEEWGEAGLLGKLRGMFAFALYDSVRHRAILARDRLGIKPLYYWFDSTSGCLGFASEVKAIVAGGLVPKETDREALAGFLLLGSVPSPLTINREVQCLLPGHYLIAEGGAVRITRYWDLDYATDSLQPGRLAEVLREAVARHLVSDVPLGIFLSGGVDSAGLVALARPAQSRLKTLTIGFGETEFNETVEARRIAEHFETEHHELHVSSADFCDELPRVLAAMDQPTNDGVNSYFVSKAAREAGLTVVLSGLGGDELFWGYPHYHWMARNRGLMNMFARAPDFLRKLCAGGAVACGRVRGREGWMRLGALGENAGPGNLYLAFRGFFPREHVQALMGATSSEMKVLCEGNSERLRAPGNHGVSANGVNYIEMKRYLHDQLLRDTDVFGMAHSVEIRVPYLDDEVVGIASMSPANEKTNGASNKPLLVEAIGEALVSEASRRAKRGFVLPTGRWMKERANTMREMALHADVLDKGAINKLWSAFEHGRLHWSRAWSLVVLGARA